MLTTMSARVSISLKSAAIAASAATALERSRATTKLLAHKELRPYLSSLAPHMAQLAPHVVRLNDLYDIYAPYLAALVPQLPRLLPHLRELLDDLPYLVPQLETFVQHQAALLPCLEHIAPLLYDLQPHRDTLAENLPTLAPYVSVFAPHLDALVPYLGPLLDALAEKELPPLAALSSKATLERLLPHLGYLAGALPELAPHWPRLLERLPFLDAQKALQPLFARLPEHLPHLAELLEQCEAIGPRLPLLLGNPDALGAELRAIRARGGASSAAEAAEKAAEPGLWGGIVRFIGGGDEAAKVAAEEAEKAEEEARLAAQAAAERESERAAQRAVVGRVSTAVDLAARRMAALEQEFVACKHTSALRHTKDSEEALRCMAMEVSLLDVDEGLDSLRGQACQLQADIARLEKLVGAEGLMRGREARQIEQLNGHGEGSVPRVSRGNAAAPTNVSPRNKTKGFFGTVEEYWTAKIAL